jgi:hypothetical protein
MITNVPELLEPYKARVNSVFAELEKLRVERKVEIPDLKITATKEFLGMKDKNEEKDEAIEVELVKEEMQDPYYDSGNPYGIPEEDLMKIKAKIEDLERKGLTGDTNHFDEARRLEGTIGKVRYASDKIGVEGLRESKYLTPDQKEAILERAFRYDLEGNKIAVLQVETGEKTSLGNISSPYRYIAEVITVVPELVRKHKSEILSLFERIEKLVLEGKLKKDSVKTLTADRKTIMDFLKLSEKKQEEPPAQAKAPKPVDRFEKMTVAEAKAIDPATLSYDDALEYRKRLLNLMFGSKADPQLKNDKVLDAKSEGVEILLTSKFSLAHIKQKYGSTEHYLLLAPYIEAIRPFSDPYYAKLGPYFGHRTKVDIISAVESLMSRAKYVEINKFRTVLERFMGTVGSAQRDPEKFLIDFSENYYKYNY